MIDLRPIRELRAQLCKRRIVRRLHVRIDTCVLNLSLPIGNARSRRRAPAEGLSAATRSPRPQKKRACLRRLISAGKSATATRNATPHTPSRRRQTGPASLRASSVIEQVQRAQNRSCTATGETEAEETRSSHRATGANGGVLLRTRDALQTPRVPRRHQRDPRRGLQLPRASRNATKRNTAQHTKSVLPVIR
jgi:hypothetical protein